jgi:hypothetical protein
MTAFFLLSQASQFGSMAAIAAAASRLIANAG